MNYKVVLYIIFTFLSAYAISGINFNRLFSQNKVIEAIKNPTVIIIAPIKTSLSANEFVSVAGILNGTTNYILTKMEEDNLSYDECLKRAQELGYAETDPTGDVEGYDAMYKIAILANIVFNKRIDINKIYREGITKISAQDIQIADELGYKIKLIAYAQKTPDQLTARAAYFFFKRAHYPYYSITIANVIL